MTITTTTHLNFRGDARAALEFYQSVFGGELTAVTYADARRRDRPGRGRPGHVGPGRGRRGLPRHGVRRARHTRRTSPATTRSSSPSAATTPTRSPGYWDGSPTARRVRGRRSPRPVVAALRHAHRPLRRHLGARRRGALGGGVRTEAGCGGAQAGAVRPRRGNRPHRVLLGRRLRDRADPAGARHPRARREVLGTRLLPAVLALWPTFFAYGLSFAIIALNWVFHHRKFRVIVRFDAGLIWINLAFLAARGPRARSRPAC